MSSKNKQVQNENQETQQSNFDNESQTFVPQSIEIPQENVQQTQIRTEVTSPNHGIAALNWVRRGSQSTVYEFQQNHINTKGQGYGSNFIKIACIFCIAFMIVVPVAVIIAFTLG